MATSKAVYDGKPHAEARTVKLECNHTRHTYQVITGNTKLYCMTCDKDVAVKVVL